MSESTEREGNGTKGQSRIAYEAIRSDILAGRHAPDKKLKILDLASELDISPGAVREALSRLVPEQLVVSRDQRGFLVAPVSLPDLIELTDLRCEIEAIALRRAVEQGDVEWEANLIAAAHRLGSISPQAAGDDVPRRSWVEAHAAFHGALVAGCTNRRLLTLHAQLHEQSERYRAIAARIESERDIAREHREIVELALARDADGLVDAMIAHLQTTTRLVTDS